MRRGEAFTSDWMAEVGDDSEVRSIVPNALSGGHFGSPATDEWRNRVAVGRVPVPWLHRDGWNWSGPESVGAPICQK